MTNLNIKPYLQTHPHTCGVACMMMALHHFNQSYILSRKTEVEVYRRARLLDASASIPALAKLAAKQKLNVIYHQQYEKIKYVPLWSKVLFEKNLKLHEKYLAEAERAGVKIKFGGFSLKYLLRQLDCRRLVITLVTAKGPHRLHNILLTGHGGNTVYGVDPSRGWVRIPETALDKKMQTPVGKVALIIWRQ